jgi:GNAT superfamily N-acetyltransferase
VRSAGTGDEEFLRRLYATRRQQELAAWGWDSAAQAAFVELQFCAQRAHYQHCWPRARNEIVLVAGLPVGRRLIDRSPERLHLVDIALLPEYRGVGLGGALVQELLDEAAGCSLPLYLRVLMGNPALRLYERLGLRPTGSATPPYLEMVWQGTGATAQTALT